jgi:DNA repair exonuclease SbcCD ATPase subunit
MFEELNTQLSSAKEKLAMRRVLQETLVKTEDNLKQETHRLHVFGSHIEQIEDDIRTLESISLTGLVYALTGNKQPKLQEMRAEREAFLDESESCAKTVESVQRQLADLQQQVEALVHADDEYEKLLAEKEHAVTTSGDGQCNALAEITAERDEVRQQERNIAKTVEAAEDVINRLSSLDRAVNRARNKRIRPYGMMMGFATVYNTAQQKATTPLITRAREGIERLCTLIDAFSLDLDSATDQEIGKLASGIRMFTVELTAGWIEGAVHTYGATHTMSGEIHALIGQLREKLETTSAQGRQIEAKRREQIENAA